MSKILFYEDYMRVIANDPCRTFVPIEEVPDPSDFFSFEDARRVKSINDIPSWTIEPKSTYFSIRETNGCAHISIEEGPVSFDQQGDFYFNTEVNENPQNVSSKEIYYSLSNRHKIVDKIKNREASSGYYHKKFVATCKIMSVYAGFSGWNPAAGKLNMKTLPKKGKSAGKTQRVFRKSLEKVKRFGFSTRDFFQVDILEAIAE